MAAQESFFLHLRPDTVMPSFSKISLIFPPHASIVLEMAFNIFSPLRAFLKSCFFGDRFHRIRVA